MNKLVRVTTVPISLEKLLEGQVGFFSQFYDVIAVSSEKEKLENYGSNQKVRTFYVDLSRSITPIKDLKAVFKLYKFLKKEKPFIIHTHTPKAGIVGMLSGKMAGVPHRLHTVAGLPLLEASGFKRKLLNSVEKFTYRLATKVYPNSIGLKEIILKEGFSKKEKLKVLGKGSSNGIDTSYFNPALYEESDRLKLRQKLNIPSSDFIFLFIGRLVGDKGINELVQSFKEFKKTHENSHLLLVGWYEDLDPLSADTMEAIKTDPGISDIGFQQDVRPYFAIADVLLFPSYREGFPNVVLQAGAMAVPSVVTNINGCNEIIKENVNGLIIPSKDSVALLKAMYKVYSEPLFLKKLKSNCRDIISKNFDRNSFWTILLNEYQSLEKDTTKIRS